MFCKNCEESGCRECGRCECPDWISVKDQLPDEPGFYIVSDGKNVGFAWKGFHLFEVIREHNTFVTHWMPLPKPPEE